ncbi:PREDICTED: beta-1,3-galactosyltransferase 1-like [Cyprinodon variegatus]|uniref:Hexosyltransferase n=1 Tax=Cyprinodon variegatus TaxID=28743 RepID=A0A3Q2FFY1_CYPVA|nr:PREDICTED: beta-1,3-galactosyltransferase 1-like [Cyprinodon variegatus]
MNGQSQKIENGDRPAETRRCLGFSGRHSLFLSLVFGVMLFFYFTNMRGMSPEWNPKQWMQSHSTKLFIPFSMQSKTNSSRSKGKAAGASIGLAQDATTARHPQLPSWLTERILKAKAAWQTAAPYVTRGPYLVEYPYEYHFTINEPQKCEQEKSFVVLMVPVAPHNRAHRDVIRSTWGSEKMIDGKAVTLFFLLGKQTESDAEQVHQQLVQESKDHHDLIQSDFVDCYKNLTIKTMVMLEWLNSFCSSAAYTMKIDSDIFLNVPNLVTMLQNAPRTNYMTGLVVYEAQVLRDPSSKWYVPMSILSDPVYPPYALGLGYILSLDLTKKLVEASQYVKAFYIEDAYLGLCMYHLGIRPVDPPNEFSFHVFPLIYNRCDYSKVIATTVHGYEDRVSIWRDIKRPGPHC